MNEAELEALVIEFVERREGGEVLDIESYVAAHPAGGERLRKTLSALMEQEALLSSSSDEAPSQIGEYLVQAELGRGGVGRVFRVAHRAHPERSFALKLLGLSARFDARALERFRREGEALAKLAHPDVVRVHEYGVLEATPYLVLDYIEGESLAQRIEVARREAGEHPGAAPCSYLHFGAPEESERAVAIFVARCARAVAAVHAAGLLHRDLKPSNLLLRTDGAPVLIDFGLAGGEVLDTLTASGDVLGTPAYMAPEQARGERCDERADVYGLGAILYELLTLKPPHAGRDALSVLEAVRRIPALPPRRVTSGLSRQLDHVVRRALAFRKERRFAHAEELAEVLELFAAGRRSPRATLSWGLRAEEFLRWHRRRFAIAMALIAVCGSAWFFTQWQRNERARQLVQAVEDVTRARFRVAPEELEQAVLALKEHDASAPLVAIYGTHQPPVDAWAEWEMALARTEAALRADGGNRASDPQVAVAAAEELLRLRPGSALSSGLLGLALYRAADYERALRELTAAVRSVPDASVLHAAIGDTQRKLKNHAECREAYRRALDLESHYAPWWYEFARAAAQSEKQAEGLEAIERAIELAGAEVRPDYWRTQAALLDNLGRKEEAIPILRQLTAAQPSVQSFYSLGRVLDGLCKLEEACAAYENGLKLNGKHAPTIASLIHLYTGSNRTGCKLCKQAFDAHPELYAPERAETLALAYLDSDRGKYEYVSYIADYMKRIEERVAFRAELDRLLREDFSAEALGRLLRARRTLD